jgi:hypothetical protein
VAAALADRFAQFRHREQLASRKSSRRSGAGAVAPTTYVGPYGGVVTEAHLSGTPAITTDWGAFTETNQHGVTGFRCRTMEQFVWAVRNVGRIDPGACRGWAESNFSVGVAPAYDDYFNSVMDVYAGNGWYDTGAATWVRSSDA